MSRTHLVVMRLPGGGAVEDLCAAVNMPWEPQRVVLPHPPAGRFWRRALDTSRPSPDDIVDVADQLPYLDVAYLLAPRSIVVFEA